MKNKKRIAILKIGPKGYLKGFCPLEGIDGGEDGQCYYDKSSLDIYPSKNYPCKKCNKGFSEEDLVDVIAGVIWDEMQEDMLRKKEIAAKNPWEQLSSVAPNTIPCLKLAKAILDKILKKCWTH